MVENPTPNARQELIDALSVLHEFIAPKIIQNEFAKRVITLQLFMNPLNGERLHLLQIGEPASGKSEIAKEVVEIFPNSRYFGTHPSTVGFIEGIVACDGGTVIVDELDKQPTSLTIPLYEAMETQNITYDIHNQHLTLKARVNVSALINPVGDRFSKDIPLVMQIPDKFRQALLSRFDFFVPFKTVPSQRYEEISKMMREADNKEDRLKTMRDRVIEIKHHYPNVAINEDLASHIGKITGRMKDYSPMRDLITPRTIRGFHFFVMARARMCLRNYATQEDVDYVKELFDRVYYGRVGA